MAEERAKTIKNLREFGGNFKLSEGSEAQRDKKNNGEVRELLNFHQRFHLHLTEPCSENGEVSATETKEAPNTLSLPRVGPPSTRPSANHKKRRQRKPPRAQQFSDVYELIGEELGKGAYSSVRTCRRKSDSKEFAVKIIPTDKPGVREKVLREIEIFYLCRNNKSILQLIQPFEEEDRFCLIFEKMHGGHLLAHIQKRERFVEREASEVVREVAAALVFLHENGVAHRDLKPQNVLCVKRDQITPVRICDFDLSSMVVNPATPTKTPVLFTPVGSAEFMAPEVVETFRGDVFSYDKKCDLWSLGVMLYMMLSGRPPFSGQCGGNCGWQRGEECSKCQDMLLSSITNGHFEFPEKEWASVSAEAKDLIMRLLVRDASERLSAKQVLQHPWVKQGPPDTPLGTPGLLSSMPTLTEELGRFAASCAHYSRQLSSTDSGADHTHFPSGPPHPVTLSPPGSSQLAVRRQHPDSDLSPPQTH
jgi:MAP kinase interacting serine/threonine kinase